MSANMFPIAQGLEVAVLPTAPELAADPAAALEGLQGARWACLAANEALLHRALYRRPMSLLKYAMTLDGKIATNTWHSAWVSSVESRAKVFEVRMFLGRLGPNNLPSTKLILVCVVCLQALPILLFIGAAILSPQK